MKLSMFLNSRNEVFWLFSREFKTQKYNTRLWTLSVNRSNYMQSFSHVKMRISFCTKKSMSYFCNRTNLSMDLIFRRHYRISFLSSKRFRWNFLSGPNWHCIVTDIVPGGREINLKCLVSNANFDPSYLF